MPILRKLYEKLTEDTEIVEPPSTHPEYPDFVFGYCYRLHTELGTSRYRDIKSIITASFVLPRNVKHIELGFNTNLTSGMGVIGGSQLSFLSLEDAKKFIDKYLSDKDDIVPYLSKNEPIKLTRADAFSDIPVYLASSYIPKDPKKVSSKLLKRVEIDQPKYEKNTFISNDSEIKKLQMRLSAQHDNLQSEITDKLEQMKKFCGNVEELIDYTDIIKSQRAREIAKGKLDEKISAISAWWCDTESCSSSGVPIFLIIDKKHAYFCSNMVLNFNINKLDDNIKKRVNEYAFIRILASELAALYNSGVRNASTAGGNYYPYYPGTSNININASRQNEIDLSPNKIKFRFSSVYAYKNLETLIEDITEATENIKEAIINADKEFSKLLFTFDDLDEEGE